jgi:hypothetical protein
MAQAGFPGAFQAGTTTGYINIGAVQKNVTQAGFPGTFQNGTSTGYLDIGAVQKNQGNVVVAKGIMTTKTGWWGDI